MRFTPTGIPDAFVIDPDLLRDERGTFACVWTLEAFQAQGLHGRILQSNVARSVRRGTLRGLHYQVAPHQQAKLVRCTAGAVFDVLVDLRPESPTFKKWFGVELTPQHCRMLYVPEGCAHGYVTLADQSEVFYHVSAYYAPQAERGVRWNDPVFSIEWPIEPTVFHPRDRDYPDFSQ